MMIIIFILNSMVASNSAVSAAVFAVSAACFSFCIVGGGLISV